MRRMTLSAGLIVAATSAFGESGGHTVPPADDTIVLANGCVYAPNLLQGDGIWSLMDGPEGDIAPCDLAIFVEPSEPSTDPVTSVFRGLAQADPADEDQLVSRSKVTPITAPRSGKPVVVIRPHYVVGAFR